MSQASEQLLSADQAKRLVELLDILPRKGTGDKRWDVLQLRLNVALYTAYKRRKKGAATVAQTDALLDALLQRLLDTYPGATDPVTEQRVGDISDALNEARRFLGAI
jgi:hypothetical protein